MLIFSAMFNKFGKTVKNLMFKDQISIKWLKKWRQLDKMLLINANKIQAFRIGLGTKNDIRNKKKKVKKNHQLMMEVMKVDLP